MLPTSSLFRIQHQPALKHANNTNQYFKDSGFKQKYSWCTGSSTSASAVTVLFVKIDHKGNHTLNSRGSSMTQCLWAMWESQPQKQTDWPPMWRRDVRLCVCDCTMFRYVLNICRASACIPACTCQGGTVKWLCGVRQIFVWLSAITSTAACFSCSINASRIDATVRALH